MAHHTNTLIAEVCAGEQCGPAGVLQIMSLAWRLPRIVHHQLACHNAVKALPTPVVKTTLVVSCQGRSTVGKLECHVG